MASIADNTMESVCSLKMKRRKGQLGNLSHAALGWPVV